MLVSRLRGGLGKVADRARGRSCAGRGWVRGEAVGRALPSPTTPLLQVAFAPCTPGRNGVEAYDPDVAPVARVARPALGSTGSGRGVDAAAVRKNGHVPAVVAFRRCHEANSAVLVVIVVPEWEDGRVEIHAGGGALPYSRFDENPSVTQGAIVENKRLGVALATIQSAQIARDRMRLESKKLTLWTKARIKAAREEADRAPVPGAEKSGYPKAVVAFLEQFELEERQRREAAVFRATERRQERDRLRMQPPV